MKLLQPTEREVVVRAEENRNRQKAVELSNEISELTKKYNRATNEILKAEEKLYAEHRDFRKQLEDEIDSLHDRAIPLRLEIKKGLEPLKLREKETSELLNKALKEEERIKDFEASVLSRELEARRLKDRAELLRKEADKDLKSISQREKDLEYRKRQFEGHRLGQEGLLKQSEDKLRKWLENERVKLRKNGPS